MTIEETVSLLKRIYEKFPGAKEPSKSAIEDFHQEFSDVPVVLVWEAFKAWLKNDERGFPPHEGMICREVDKILFKNESETFEEAQARRSRNYLKAYALEGTFDGPRGKYNPYQEGILEKEVPFIWKRIEKIWQDLEAQWAPKPRREKIKILLEERRVSDLRHLKFCGMVLPDEALQIEEGK